MRLVRGGERSGCALLATVVVSFLRSSSRSGAEVPIVGTVQIIHARCICIRHLPRCIARCTMKSDRRMHPQATRRQRGRAVTRTVTGRDRVPVTGSRGANHAARSAPRLARRGGHCHGDQSAKTALASQVRQRTGRGRTAAADTATSWDPGSYPLRDPQTRRWAGAAIPAQRNTTQRSGPS